MVIESHQAKVIEYTASQGLVDPNPVKGYWNWIPALGVQRVKGNWIPAS